MDQKVQTKVVVKAVEPKATSVEAKVARAPKETEAKDMVDDNLKLDGTLRTKVVIVAEEKTTVPTCARSVGSLTTVEWRQCKSEQWRRHPGQAL